MKPFLKWAGNKYRIIDRIKAVLPEAKRLIEPFAGSAAVFLNTTYRDNLISDANADLINLYQVIQSDGYSFIEYAEKLFVPQANMENVFYEYRNEFNSTSDIRRKSALFVYLNRHCFNGLCRYNSAGKFNVPFGRYTKPVFPKLEILAFSEKSKQATFVHSDFEMIMNQAVAGDVVYCDPPYVPLSSTSSFTDYTKAGFGLSEQRRLAELAIELMEKGVPVIISNHNTPFTRDVYSRAKVDSFDVQRFISGTVANRNKASELLAVFE